MSTRKPPTLSPRPRFGQEDAAYAELTDLRPFSPAALRKSQQVATFLRNISDEEISSIFNEISDGDAVEEATQVMALRTLLADHESGLHPFPIESAAFQAPAQTAGVALSPPELAEEQLPIPTAAEIKAHMAAVRAQRLAASGGDAARSKGSAWVRALFGFS